MNESARPDRKEILNDVETRLRAFLKDPATPMAESTSFTQLDGVDSAKLVDLILQLEDCYDFRMSARDMDDLRTVGSLVDIVAAKAVWPR